MFIWEGAQGFLGNTKISHSMVRAGEIQTVRARGGGRLGCVKMSGGVSSKGSVRHTSGVVEREMKHAYPGVVYRCWLLPLKPWFSPFLML